MLENYSRKYPDLILGKKNIYRIIKKLINRIKYPKKLINYNLKANFLVKVIIAIN